MPIQLETIIHKEAAGKIRCTMTYVLSDATIDRYGEIIEPDGWDLRWFKKNPIALFNHNPHAPIGKWRNVRVENKQLIADLEPAQRGTSLRVVRVLHWRLAVRRTYSRLVIADEALHNI